MNIPTSNFPKGVPFSELSKLGLDRTLFEYAGMIDMGTSFKIDPDSPIALNIIDYLKEQYGDLDRMLELWMDAMDAKNGDMPIYLYRRLVPLDLKKINEVLHKSTFMIEDPSASMKERGIFQLKDGQTCRLYHEGRTFLNRQRLVVDDDPSPFLTVSNIRSRGQLRLSGEILCGQKTDVSKSEFSSFTTPENIVRDNLDEDWVPSAEQLPKFLAQLRANGTKYKIFEHPSGYVRPCSPYIIDKYESHSEFRMRNGVRCTKKPIEFYSLQEWHGSYDASTQTRNKGKKTQFTFDEQKEFSRISSGYIIVIPGRPAEEERKNLQIQRFFSDGTVEEDFIDLPSRDAGHYKMLYIPKGNVPNAFPTISEKKALKEKESSLTGDVLSRMYVWDNRNENWKQPYTFTTKEGKKVVVNPKPGTCDRSAWATWKRCFSKLNTLRQLINEERWEYIALEKNDNSIDIKDAPLLAYEGVKEEVAILVAQIEWAEQEREFGLSEKQAEDFRKEASELLVLLEQKVFNPQDDLEEIVMNARVGEPEKSRKTPVTSLDSACLTQLRRIYPKSLNKDKILELSKIHTIETGPMDLPRVVPSVIPEKKMKKKRNPKVKDLAKIARSTLLAVCYQLLQTTQEEIFEEGFNEQELIDAREILIREEEMN